MPKISTYNKTPMVAVSSSSQDCNVGWSAVVEQLRAEVKQRPFVICVECYPGCFEHEIQRELIGGLQPGAVVPAAGCYLPETAIKLLVSGMRVRRVARMML